ncbi:hypothetical protein BHE74_00041145 [Ensete ventricosum]|nr:hypothetical protein BHE74_00041145 [Ensete ventricosum]
MGRGRGSPPVQNRKHGIHSHNIYGSHGILVMPTGMVRRDRIADDRAWAQEKRIQVNCGSNMVCIDDTKGEAGERWLPNPIALSLDAAEKGVHHIIAVLALLPAAIPIGSSAGTSLGKPRRSHDIQWPKVRSDRPYKSAAFSFLGLPVGRDSSSSGTSPSSLRPPPLRGPPFSLP